MTMMTTIISVALGITPIPAEGAVVPISTQHDERIGSFSETTDDTGTTHLIGSDRNTGHPFHITVNPYGRVEGTVGDWEVSFQVKTVS